MPLGTGLIADFAREQGAQAMVKGIRNSTDLNYEMPMATFNRHLSSVETVFLPQTLATSTSPQRSSKKSSDSKAILRISFPMPLHNDSGCAELVFCWPGTLEGATSASRSHTDQISKRINKGQGWPTRRLSTCQ